MRRSSTKCLRFASQSACAAACPTYSRRKARTGCAATRTQGSPARPPVYRDGHRNRRPRFPTRSAQTMAGTLWLGARSALHVSPHNPRLRVCCARTLAHEGVFPLFTVWIARVTPHKHVCLQRRLYKEALTQPWSLTTTCVPLLPLKPLCPPLVSCAAPCNRTSLPQYAGSSWSAACGGATTASGTKCSGACSPGLQMQPGAPPLTAACINGVWSVTGSPCSIGEYSCLALLRRQDSGRAVCIYV